MIYTLLVAHGHEVWIKSKEHCLIVIAYVKKLCVENSELSAKLSRSPSILVRSLTSQMLWQW